ncbi:MAG: hypothetical protein AABW41_05305 [Nanoarchaeota archaeon]
MKGLFPPTIDGTVYLELTHRCNYRCKHCYAECPKQAGMSCSHHKALHHTLSSYGKLCIS